MSSLVSSVALKENAEKIAAFKEALAKEYNLYPTSVSTPKGEGAFTPHTVHDFFQKALSSSDNPKEILQKVESSYKENKDYFREDTLETTKIMYGNLKALFKKSFEIELGLEGKSR